MTVFVQLLKMSRRRSRFPAEKNRRPPGSVIVRLRLLSLPQLLFLVPDIRDESPDRSQHLIPSRLAARHRERDHARFHLTASMFCLCSTFCQRALPVHGTDCFLLSMYWTESALDVYHVENHLIQLAVFDIRIHLPK